MQPITTIDRFLIQSNAEIRNTPPIGEGRFIPVSYNY
jgi:hypothetical protein